jgi:hypothetical protein
MSKKTGIGLAVAVIGIIAASVFYLSTQAGAWVADAIEDYGRATTGTEVSVGGVALALADGRGRVGNLTIANPDGFDTDYFLRVRDVDLSLDLGSLRTDVPIIREVVVDGAHLNAEQRGDATNLTEIQRHMTASSAPATQPPAAQGRVIIDRFRLVNSHVTLTSELLSKPEDLTLEEVVVNEIGRRAGGVTYDEATEAMLAPILGAARTAVQRRLRDAAGDAARDELREKASERLRELTQD